MEYVLELWHKGECLEHRTLNDSAGWGAPAVGDLVHLTFDNPNTQAEHGQWWKVTERRVLLFAKDSGVRTIQLMCDRANPDAPRMAKFGTVRS